MEYENTVSNDAYLESINTITYNSYVTLNSIHDTLKSFSFLTCTFVITIFFYLFFHNITNRRDV